MAEVAGSKVLTEDEIDSSSLEFAIDEILGNYIYHIILLVYGKGLLHNFKHGTTFELHNHLGG
jgi:predicted methyltransferase MtxX (methanogen marker protein 4)